MEWYCDAKHGRFPVRQWRGLIWILGCLHHLPDDSGELVGHYGRVCVLRFVQTPVR
jgi:hypothetical protein